jgi:hypothetical protein
LSTQQWQAPRLLDSDPTSVLEPRASQTDLEE